MSDRETRPAAATLFGVLDIVFGLLGISSLHAVGSPGISFHLVIIIAVVLVSLLAVAAGILLLADRRAALRVNLHFALASIALAVLWLAFELAAGGPGGMAGSLPSIAINVIFPVLVLVVLLRDPAVAGFYRPK